MRSRYNWQNHDWYTKLQHRNTLVRRNYIMCITSFQKEQPSANRFDLSEQVIQIKLLHQGGLRALELQNTYCSQNLWWWRDTKSLYLLPCFDDIIRFKWLQIHKDNKQKGEGQTKETKTICLPCRSHALQPKDKVFSYTEDTIKANWILRCS